MSRYERKVYFERLVAMREAYRAEAHAALELTMADAMSVVQRVLTEDAAGQPATTGAKPADAERKAA